MKRLKTLALTAVAGVAMSIGSAAQAVQFYVLNTEGGTTFRGRIETFTDTDTTRSTVADVDPTPFGAIGDWKAMATDGEGFFFLNTDGGGAFPGRIDRTDLDGSNRSTVTDLDPSQFTDIEDWRGLATDGDFFYLLNTESTGTARGRVDRVNLDGTGRVTLFDLEPSPFSNITAWKGFATDGNYFYLLNTDGSTNGAFPGRIDRVDLDGTNRTTILDIAPDPYNSIQSWQGFAVAPAVPEPAGLGILSVFAVGLMSRRRRA